MGRWGHPALATMSRVNQTARRPFGAALADRQFQLLLLAIVGLAGWLGVALLASAGLAAKPATAGFDLQVIVDAARRVASGLGPYAPATGSGAIQAESLFYSYPPPLAQALSLVASVPLWLLLAVVAVGATGGLWLVARQLAGARLALATVAIAPFVYPFAVALLFGNVDAWFPLLYGLVLLGAATAPAAGEGRRIGAFVASGIALALASVKLYPAALGLWLLVRGVGGSRSRTAWPILAVALVAVAVVTTASLLVGGTGPWSSWLDLVRSGTGADVAGRLNIGPGSQVALLVGRPDLARAIAALGSLAAVVVIAWAAFRIDDSLTSFGIAAAASLVVLPVTWFHYPVALMPIATAALGRAAGTPAARATAGLVALAVVVAALSIVLPVTLWVAVAAVLAAAWRSAPERADAPGAATLDSRPTA